MFDLFSKFDEGKVSDIDVRGYFEQKVNEGSIEWIVCSGILDGRTLICRFCCGFVDETCSSCSHCGEDLRQTKDKTILAFTLEEFLDSKNKNQVDAFDNEGEYSGRRGEVSLTYDYSIVHIN